MPHTCAVAFLAVTAAFAGAASAGQNSIAGAQATTGEPGERPLVFDGAPVPAPPETISRDAAGHVTIRAVRLHTPLRIDGSLDEAVYGNVRAMSNFIQTEPHEGEPATEKTDAWILFDEDNVYVSVRCWESRPDHLVANEMRRDNSGIAQNDYVAIILDTFYDRRNGVTFTISPIGGRMDAQITNERQVNLDWNPIWNFRVGRFAGGWTVEAALPFRSLQYQPGRVQLWSVNISRNNRSKNELSYLTGIPNAYGPRGLFLVSRAATLVGLEVPTGSRNLDVKPSFTADAVTDRTAARQVTREVHGDFGVDAKYGISSNLTADLTYNTDFAQFDAEQQQVNLSSFILLFTEKRDFFLENQGAFTFGGEGASAGDTPILFYSRRIGVADNHVVPLQIGGRLTGRVGRYTLGVLGMRTDKEPLSGSAPTNFTVVRVKRNVLRRSSIGTILTHRSISQDGSGANAAYGLDGTFSFFTSLTANLYWARTRAERIRGSDTSYRTQLDYAGDRYGLQLERLVVGRSFHPDVGFVRRSDMQRSHGQFRFSPRPRAIEAVRKFSGTGTFTYVADGSGHPETRILDGEFGVEFQSSDRLTIGYADTYEFLPKPLPIAGLSVVVPIGGYHYRTFQTTLSTGQQRRLSGSVSAEGGTFYDGTKITLGVSRGRIEVTPRISVEPTASVNWLNLAEGSLTTTLLGSRLTYTLTPFAFVSALVQYTSVSHEVAANVRLRWEYGPGSEFFVVYNEQRDTLVPSFPAIKNRALIIKANHLFRF